MKLGMTGNRNGLSEKQKSVFRDFLFVNTISAFHHGDCIGSDADAHDIADEEGVPIHVHPPINPTLRAYKDGVIIHPEKDYLARNRDIVCDTDLLVGFPGQMFETRGGTWYTINYAKKNFLRYMIIWPDGTIETG